MRLKLIFGLFMISAFWGAGLSAQAVRHISLEVGGVGGFGALSYEREVLKKGAFRMDLRFGFSFVPVDANNGSALIFPVLAHGLIGNGQHQLDLGIGQALTVTTKGSLFVLMPASIGYRFSPGKGKVDGCRLYLRPAYTPLISYLLDFQWQHWAGLTIGLRI